MFNLEDEGAAEAGTATAPAAKSTKKRSKAKKKAKTRKPAKRIKATKPKKSKTRKPAKTKKAGKKRGNNRPLVRTERLDMRLSKAEKAKVTAKAKKLKCSVTEVITKAIASLR